MAFDINRILGKVQKSSEELKLTEKPRIMVSISEDSLNILKIQLSYDLLEHTKLSQDELDELIEKNIKQIELNELIDTKKIPERKLAEWAKQKGIWSAISLASGFLLRGCL